MEGKQGRKEGRKEERKEGTKEGRNKGRKKQKEGGGKLLPPFLERQCVPPLSSCLSFFGKAEYVDRRTNEGRKGRTAEEKGEGGRKDARRRKE